jgi:hypothetical protein
LTSQGVYRLLYNSKKDQAKKFRKWAGNILDDIIFNESKEIKKQLEEQKRITEEQQKLIENQNDKIENLKLESLLHKHNILLLEYAKECNINYLVLVQELLNGDYIIKYGESRKGIVGRYEEHKNKYPTCIILECWEVIDSHGMEKFVHSRLSEWNYKEMENHEHERELFYVGKGLTLNYIKQLVNDNLYKFNDPRIVIKELTYKVRLLELENNELRRGENYNLHTEITKLRLENELLNQLTTSRVYNENKLLKLELQQLKNDSDYKQVQLPKPKPKTKIEEQNKVPVTIVNQINGERAHTTGDKVQQINPENMTLVKTWQNVTDILRTLKYPRSSVVKAIKENTIYGGFRWVYVDEDQPPHIIKDNI